VGVPDIVPVIPVPLIVIPCGIVPKFNEYVYGAVPPLAVSTTLYGSIVFPEGIVGGSIVIFGALIDSTYCSVPENPYLSVAVILNLNVPAIPVVPLNCTRSLSPETSSVIPSGRLAALTVNV